MGNIKQINIKNWTYYFHNNIINIKEFNSSLLKIDKKYKDIDIYYIGYVTIKKIGDYENIYRVNPLYLIIGKVDGYIEEDNGNKYLVFDSIGENKEVLKKYAELWDGIKNEIETIKGGIYVDKTNTSKKCDICHYWYFKDIGFKYEPYPCNVVMI